MAKPATIPSTATFELWRTTFNTVLGFVPETVISPNADPTATDDDYFVPTFWVREDTNEAWILVHTTVTNDAVWLKLAGESDVNFLEGRYWTIQNSATTAVIGSRYMANNHAGFALTMPAAFALPTGSSLADIWVINSDDAEDVTLTPAAGDQFFIEGVGQGVDTTVALSPGNFAILSPRAANTSWDLIIVGGGGGEVTLTGDVTGTGEGTVPTTVANDVITNSKLANMSGWTIKVRNAGTTGDPSDVTLADLTFESDPVGSDYLLIFSAGGLRSFFLQQVADFVWENPLGNAVENSHLADMGAYTLKVRNAGTTGDPQDVKVSSMTEEPSPAAGDWILGERAEGELRKYNVGNFVNQRQLTPTAAGDHTVSGTTALMQVGENVVFGQPLFVHTDGKLYLADANVDAERVIAMAAATINTDATGLVLLFGFARDDSWAWSVGGTIYLSEANGTMTQTAPSTSGANVQVLGRATHADRMLFNPSPDWIKVS